MILVDANLLLYAENESGVHHDAARSWWEAQLSGSAPVALCWTVINAYLRIGTNPRVFDRPATIAQAVARVGTWLDQPCVRVIHPTEQHWTIFRQLLLDGQAKGNLVTDAHLAALAIEHGCQLASTDADFSRFRNLKWINPIASLA